MNVQRRLAAILAADVAGCSRLMGEDGVASGTVLAARMQGESSLVHLAVAQDAGAEDLHLHVRIPGRPRPREGNTVGIKLDADRVFVFPIAEG